MGLLEDARRVVAGPCPTYWEWEAPTLVPEGYGGGTVLKCAHCGQKLHAHAPDCPRLSMPRIITALEVAEDLVAHAGVLFSDHDRDDERPDEHLLTCSMCGGEVRCDCTEGECDSVAPWTSAMERNYPGITHEQDCLARALVAALRDEATNA